MAYSKVDKTIEISAWIVLSLILIKFVPKNKVREANLAFLFMQMITWFFGLLVVEKKLITYPSRLLFKKSSKTSFTFEYFFYPAVCSLFNVFYPENMNAFIKSMYYLFYTSFITIFEIFAVKYTKLIHYKKWTWYWTSITIWSTFYISRIYFRWFFKDKSINI
jgi:hypothetical protein